jgi:hypothetical protein
MRRHAGNWPYVKLGSNALTHAKVSNWPIADRPLWRHLAATADFQRPNVNFRQAAATGVVAGATLPHMAAMPHQSLLNDPRLTVMEAIARTVLLTAQYNGQALTLAPHVLFARRGDLFVSALNLTKNWRSADEKRLGYFKLAGLAHVELTQETFLALPNFAAEALAQPDDELLLAVT